MGKTAKDYLRMGNNYYRIHNFFRAREYFTEAVNMGNSSAAAALFGMGQMYLKKDPPDYENALHCLMTLCRRGHGPSAMILGDMNEKGTGLPKNIPKAFEYFAEAYAQGERGAAYRAGCLMIPDALESTEVREIAISWFEEALSEGDKRVYGRIGQMYMSSHLQGSRKEDLREGIKWLSQGALAGDGLSLFLLSSCFMTGDGVPLDRARAVRLLEQAAEEGNVKAMGKLAYLYEKGIAVPKDPAQADRYYRMMQEKEYTQSFPFESAQEDYEAGMNYLMGQQVKKDKRKAMELFKLSAAKGSAPACRELGHFFETNEAESLRDPGKALLWYQRGMDLGEDASKKEFIRLSLQLGNQYEDRLRPYEIWRSASETLENNEELRSRFRMMASRAARHYLAAASAGSEDGWAFLARVLLYAGDWLGVPEENFLDAAKKGQSSMQGSVAKLLWQYYDGKQPHPYLAYHSENPRKAFDMAISLAKQGDPFFCAVVAGYYMEGYGTEKNYEMADKWSQGIKE